MKTTQISLKAFVIVLNVLFTIFWCIDTYAQVGINTLTPNSSSMLDINATDKGLLIPRLTSAQRLAILSPATGLMVYETTSNLFFYFDGGVWRPLDSSGTDWNISGNTGTVAGTNFIGTTDANDFVMKTTNIERMRVLSNGNVGIGTALPVQKLEINGLNTPAATSGSFPNGIARFQPAGTSLAIDLGGSGASPAHGWLQVRDNSTYGTNYNLSLNPNGGNVGINTIGPTEKLHVVGSIRIVDGNQGNGKIMTSDANGKGAWAAAPVTYFVPNTTGGIVSTTRTALTNASITFIPNHPNVKVEFSASGFATIGNSLVTFFINVNGVDLVVSPTSTEDVLTSAGNGIEWNVNTSCMVPVNPGVTNNISIFWKGNSNGATYSNSSNAVVPFHKSLIVTDM